MESITVCTLFENWRMLRPCDHGRVLHVCVLPPAMAARALLQKCHRTTLPHKTSL
jgi:hypothetical protein